MKRPRPVKAYLIDIEGVLVRDKRYEPVAGAVAWMNRLAQAGRVREIVPCIGDQEACLNEFIHGGHLQCVVNPRTGFEEQIPRDAVPAASPRRIAVVGAGPAGVTCATVAAERGHALGVGPPEAEPQGAPAPVPGRHALEPGKRRTLRRRDVSEIEPLLVDILEGIEDQVLEPLALIMHRHAPFLVVIAPHQFVIAPPGAAGFVILHHACIPGSGS